MAKRSDLLEGVRKRVLTLFFIIDNSESMAGEKIGAVNTAIKDALPEIRKIAAPDNADASIRIAALLFSSDVKWLYPAPISAAEFEWKNVGVDSTTRLDLALKELDDKLSRDKFMLDKEGSYAPVFIFMSDGWPTHEWKEEWDTIRKNKWFIHGTRAAIAIGKDADKEVLGNILTLTDQNDEKAKKGEEYVFDAANPEQLKKIIKFVAVTSSMVGTKGETHREGSPTQAVEGCENGGQIVRASDELKDKLKDTNKEGWEK